MGVGRGQHMDHGGAGFREGREGREHSQAEAPSECLRPRGIEVEDAEDFYALDPFKSSKMKLADVAGTDEARTEWTRVLQQKGSKRSWCAIGT